MFRRPSRGRHGKAGIISAGPEKMPIAGTSSAILPTSDPARSAFPTEALKRLVILSSLLMPVQPQWDPSRALTWSVLLHPYTALLPSPRQLLRRRLQGV